MKRFLLPLTIILALLAGCQTGGWNLWQVAYNDLEVSAGGTVVTLPGTAIRSVNALEDRSSDRYKISIVLTGDGAVVFSGITERSVGKELSIRARGRTILSATILAPIPDGRISLTGYTKQDAEAIVEALVRK